LGLDWLCDLSNPIFIFMSREIKFRVWEKGTKNLLGYENFNTPFNNGYFYVDLSELNNNQDEGELVCHSEFHNPPMLRPKGLNQLFREQFIGLNDKSGRQIYEGDILECKNWEPQKYKIEFIEGAFCLTNPLVSMPTDVTFLEDSTGKHFEIIGNIHQNPELLTQH